MKANLKLWIFTAVFTMMVAQPFAQDQLLPSNKKPRWVSDKGFWQIESNIKTPDKSVIYFYTNDNVLVYKEQVNGIVLNLKSKRVKMKLKKALEMALFAWHKKQVIQNDQRLISMLFN